MSGLEILTVLAGVPCGRVAELTTRLTLIGDDASPFHRVAGTHFARLVVLSPDDFVAPARPLGMGRLGRVIDAVTHRSRPQQPDAPAGPYLLLTAAHDRDVVPYPERLRTGLGAVADDIFGLCTDYPGRDSAAAFSRFLTERSVPSGYVFPAMDDQPPVAEVLRALAVRRRVTDLAVRAGALDEATLATTIRGLVPELPPGHGLEPGPARGPTADPGLSPCEGRVARGGEARGGVARGAGWPRSGRRPPDRPDLRDVQGLVTSGYPRHDVARHLLLRVTDPAAARASLRHLADFVPDGVSARDHPPALAVHLAFSHPGLAALGLPPDHLAAFPDEFAAGLSAREDALTPGRGSATYEAPFTEAPIDVLVLVSAVDAAALEAFVVHHEGLELAGAVNAGRIRQPGKRDFTEHFGFVDGISQPAIRGVTTSGPGELPPGEVLLGFADVDGDLAGAGLEPGWARHGSYLVYRRLRQHVPAFRSLVAELANASGLDTDTAAAKLMGRYRDGRPLGSGSGFQRDDPEGHVCPVGAHVRRVNPRDASPVARPSPRPRNPNWSTSWRSGTGCCVAAYPTARRSSRASRTRPTTPTVVSCSSRWSATSAGSSSSCRRTGWPTATRSGWEPTAT